MLVDGQQWSEAVELWGVAEAGRALDRAGARTQHPGAHLNESGLAGAVRADDRDDLPAAHRQVDGAQDGAPPASGADAAQAQDHLPEHRVLGVQRAGAALAQRRGELAGVQDGGPEQIARGEARGVGVGAGGRECALGLVRVQPDAGEFASQAPVPRLVCGSGGLRRVPVR